MSRTWLCAGSCQWVAVSKAVGRLVCTNALINVYTVYIYKHDIGLQTFHCSSSNFGAISFLRNNIFITNTKNYVSSPLIYLSFYFLEIKQRLDFSSQDYQIFKFYKFYFFKSSFKIRMFVLYYHIASF